MSLAPGAPSSSEGPSNDRAPRRHVSGATLWLSAIFGYFVLRLVCYAVWFHPFVPPDEVDLFARSQFFSEVLGIPEDTRRTLPFGVMGRASYLYFWLLGKALPLNVFGMDELLFARLLNVPIGLATAWYAYRCAGQITQSVPARLLVVAALTNTLGFSSLSATVTYDNLTNLLGVASAFYAFELFRTVSAGTALKLVLTLGMGCLTKLTFLPLAMLLLALLLFRRRRSLIGDLRSLGVGLRSLRGANLALAALVVCVLGLNLELYGGNFLRTGTWTAMPDNAPRREDLLQHRIYRRQWVVSAFKNGELSYEQAVAELKQVRNAGNRARGMQLLNWLRDHKDRPPALLSMDVYLVIWSRLMLERTIGFQGNGGYVVPPNDFTRYAVLLLALACAALFIRQARVDDESGIPLYAVGLSVAYMLVFVFVYNYPTYRGYGAIDNGVNGRYVLPVLPLLYAVGARYGLAILKPRVQVALCVLVAALLVASDMPWLVANMGPCWFAAAPREAFCVY